MFVSPMALKSFVGVPIDLFSPSLFLLKAQIRVLHLLNTLNQALSNLILYFIIVVF